MNEATTTLTRAGITMAGTTGPTSKTGKAKLSRNALKHGLRARKWAVLIPPVQKDEKKEH